MTQEQIAKLKAAGFSDADISDYVANEGKQSAGKKPVDPQAVTSSDLPEIDVTQKSETLRNAEAAGVPTTNPGSLLTDAAAVGTAIAPYAVPAALTAGGLYGASVAKQGFNAMRAAAEARTAQANAQMAQAQGLQQRFDQRMAQRAAPPAPAAGPQIVNASGQPMRAPGPVAPAPMAAPAPAPMAAPAPAPAAAQPSMMQRGMDYASRMRQIAAQRVIPAMGQAGQAVAQTAQQAGQMAGRGLSAVANSPIARAGGMAANALYSGELNANEAEELERRRKMAPTITR